MKRYGKGRKCVANTIISLFLLFLFSIMICLALTDFIEVYFMYYICCILCILLFTQLFVRFTGTFYELKGNIICLKYLTVKKRTKWYDFCYLGRSTYSYQKEYSEIDYKDIVFVDTIVNRSINIYLWNKRDFAIKLKNGRYIRIAKDVFSKKQVLEIVNTMMEKNKDIELGERLGKELELVKKF